MSNLPFEPVAIVGRGCILPKAASPAQLWDVVRHKRVCIGSPEAESWRVDPGDILSHEPGHHVPDRMWSDVGGYVDDVGAGKSEAIPRLTGLDAVFGWTLEAATQALASYQSATRSAFDVDSKRATGLIMGNLSYPTAKFSQFAESVYLEQLFDKRISAALTASAKVDGRNRFSSGLPAMWVAHELGLQRGSFALDAACASGLYAIKLACDRLQNREADAMLAGAVNAADPLFIHMGFCALGAMSRTGQSRPFHKEADGLVPSEGAAFVLLKRFDDALRDDDNILGIIRGAGLSNDGRSGGFLSPSSEGQVRSLQQAYACTNRESSRHSLKQIAPSDVSLIECHATGTPVGDATEIDTLQQVFGDTKLVLGSLKANLGHLITTSGVAGVLKVLSAFEHEELPATPNAHPLLDDIRNSPFRVLEEPQPWQGKHGRLIAGVSSFGFGGNNAHLVLEKWQGYTQESPASKTGRNEPQQEAQTTAPQALPLAVIAAAVHTHKSRTLEEFSALITAGAEHKNDANATGTGSQNSPEISFDAASLKFPPNDLKQSLGQQLLVLEVARAALATLPKNTLDPTTTGVYVGMGADPETCRYGLKWRLADMVRRAVDNGTLDAPDDKWLDEVKASLMEPLNAASVVGKMPNVPANRLSNQYDFRGPGFTVSQEELSGDAALDLAINALARGEIETALVAAVDLSREAVHRHALEEVTGEPATTADAAVMLVVKSLEAARRDGDRILAVVQRNPKEPTDHDVPYSLTYGQANRPANNPVRRQVGHAHAAAGLLNILAAIQFVHRGISLPTSEAFDADISANDARTHNSFADDSCDGNVELDFQPLLTNHGRREIHVRNNSFAGEHSDFLVWKECSAEEHAAVSPRATSPAIEIFAAPDRDSLIEALQRNEPYTENEVTPDWQRLAIVADADTMEAQRAKALQHLQNDRLFDGWNMGGLYYRQRAFASAAHDDNPDAAAELAFVFTGAASAYPGMGRELLLTRPELVSRLASRMQNSFAAAGWAYDPQSTRSGLPFYQLAGSSFLCQVHAEFSMHVLGLQPQASLGLSSGETNGMFALGVWQDMDQLFESIDASGLYTHALANSFDAIAQYWGLEEKEEVHWDNWRILTPVDQIREIVATTDRVYLTIINTPNDCVIGGDSAACQKLFDRLAITGEKPVTTDGTTSNTTANGISDNRSDVAGSARAQVLPLGHALAIHCPAVQPFEAVWRDLHTRPVRVPKNIRFYSNYLDGVFAISEASVADALTGQALQTIDFPKIVNMAWQDGVRVFVEHGPRNSLTSSIKEILGDKPHVAVALDQQGVNSNVQAFRAAAELWCAGVKVNMQALQQPSLTMTQETEAKQNTGKSISFRLRLPEPGSTPWPTAHTTTSSTETMTDTVLYHPPQLRAGPAHGRLMSPAPLLARISANLPTAETPPVQATLLETSPTSDTTLHTDPALKTNIPVPPPAPVFDRSPVTSIPAVPPPAPPSAPVSEGNVISELLLAAHRNLQEAHEDYLAKQSESHAAYTAAMQRRQQTLFGGQPGSLPEALPQVANSDTPAPLTDDNSIQVSQMQQKPEPLAEVIALRQPTQDAGAQVEDMTKPPAKEQAEPQMQQRVSKFSANLPGPKFGRAELEILAGGRISGVLGALFEQQDNYDVQVRMPEPPLLLCDRVLGIEGEAGSMGTGTIWTETDVREDSWYLHNGRMPGGIFIESGQADLLLISWLGIDFHNRGERAYRLLGCELIFHGDLPAPGDTLQYEIKVDGHAKQGDVRLFFFHYDCFINGEKRISVRNGQAGFFSINELENSAGVLWTADEASYTPGVVIPPSPAQCRKHSFSRQEVIAYTEGDIVTCFGEEFAWSATHTRTPRTPAGTFNFIGEVAEFDPHGGPAGRGYLKAVSPVSPDDWFFEGHFKNDPCMPGTLMADACLQMMGFYMTATGRTLHHDGWRFQPVQDTNYKFVCRGQVLPTSREMTYEIFVDEIVDGDMPMIFAHVLCTVDGRKAFLCERLGLQLVPDWPVKDMPEWSELTTAGDDPRPLATIDGFALDAKSLLNCAWGKPSTAFGPGFARFDGVGRSPRLPGPPYHFMTRISELTGEMGAMKAGATVEALYDIPDDVWYFGDNGWPTMPNAILMEIALQPCGWLASYSLAPDASKGELLFRNLDGTATQTREIVPGDKTLATRVTLQSLSKVGDLIILNFDVQCLVDGKLFLNLQTVFGFFPPEAMENQKGLAIKEPEKDILTRPGEFFADLRTHKGLFFEESSARLPASKLLMLDEIDGLWPEGGQHGRGAIRGIKYVDVTEWFFRAHFFQDPVQPGSLGIEAMLQLMQAWMLHTRKHEGLRNPRFEPIRIGEETEWHYRGQVTPAKEKITIDFEVIEEGTDARGPYLFGEARLWVDGLKIYHAPRIGMRLVEDTALLQKDDTSTKTDTLTDVPGDEPVQPVGTGAAKGSHVVNWLLSTKEDPWITDHCPTYTLPALPMTYELDMMARAAAELFPGKKLSRIQKAEAKQWISFAQAELAGHTEVEILAPDEASVQVFVQPEDGGAPVLAAKCQLAFAKTSGKPAAVTDDGQPNPPLPRLVDPEKVENLYSSGELFHGPSFQLVQSMVRGSNGATGILNAGSRGKVGKKELSGVPVGLLNPALLDAALHLIPHDNYHLWCNEVAPDMAAYPLRIENLQLYSDIPSEGLVKVEARFAGLESRLFPRTTLVLRHSDESGKDGEIVASFELLEILLPKGPLGTANPSDRRAFLRDRQYVPGLALSELGEGTATLDSKTVAATDWLPGTVGRIYHYDSAHNDNGYDLTTRVCIAEQIARHTRLHPYFSRYDTQQERCLNLPLNRLRVEVKTHAETVTATSQEPDPLDWRGVRDFWIAKSGGQHKFVHDLGAGLIHHHVRRFVVADPAAFARMQGQPALYVANHQTGVESFLLLSLLLATTKTEATAIAKKEHLQSWIGDIYKLAEISLHGESGLGMLFFDREDQGAMLASLQQYAAESADSRASLLVHAEGTRSQHGGDRVRKLSSVMIDLALKNNLPVVPLKLTGGLPLTGLEQKLEFPWHMGQQDYILGVPIACQTLQDLPYARRAPYILSALNHLGPVAEADVPLPQGGSLADRKLVDIVAKHQKSGATEVQAGLRAAIETLPDICEETKLACEAMSVGNSRSLGDLDPAEKTLIERLLGLGDGVV